MLLWHHAFFNKAEYYERFQSFFYYHGIPIECYIADICKLCVAVFVMLSGYGLYLSWKSYEQKYSDCKLSFKNQMVFVKNHLIKLLFGFWFIYLIFVPMGAFLGRPFWEIYKGNNLYGIIDFLGLANLFSTPTMNATWWFMGTIIVLYLLFPVFMKVFSYSGEALLALALLLSFLPIPNFDGLKTWLLPFVVGMYFADGRLFSRIDKRLDTVIKRVFVIGALFAVIIPSYRGNPKIAFACAIIIICLSCILLSRIPIISSVLELFGKYSSGIFMFHTFIFSYYFQSYIYWFKNPLLIFVVLSGICLLIAFLIEKAKQLIRINKLLKYLTT